MEQSKFAVKSGDRTGQLAALERNFAITGKNYRLVATAGGGSTENISRSSKNSPDLSAAETNASSSKVKSLHANDNDSPPLFRADQFPVAPVPVKDNWDKIAAIAPIISAALIFATGGYCTYTYNQQQIRIQQCQTIEKFIPHLMGNEQTKKAAILALSTLIDTETASKFASIFASTGTVSALQSLSENGSPKDKLIATQALNSALQNLAEREDKLTSIEQDYKKVIADKAKSSADNPDTPYNLNKLAQFYTIRGQYALAEPLLKKSLEMRERVYGPRHPEVVDALKSLAELYQLSGKNDLAESTLKRAREIEEKADFNSQAKEPASINAAVEGQQKLQAGDIPAKSDAEKAANGTQIPDGHAVEAPADSANKPSVSN